MGTVFWAEDVVSRFKAVYDLEAGLSDMVPWGGALSLSVSLGSQPGDYTAVRVVVRRGAVFMRTSSFAWPGSLLIPKAEPDPPVSTGPALTVILSCCPDRVAPLGC